jgi:hypothetical protein
VEKHLPILQDMVQFETLFIVAFGNSNRRKVAKTKMHNLYQGAQSAAIYAAKFQQLTCDLE